MEGSTLMPRISTLIKVSSLELLHHEVTARLSSMDQRGSPPQILNLGAYPLSLLACRSMRNKCLLFISFLVHRILLQQPKGTKTNILIKANGHHLFVFFSIWFSLTLASRGISPFVQAVQCDSLK